MCSFTRKEALFSEPSLTALVKAGEGEHYEGLSVKVEHGEELRHGDDRGSYKTVSDLEHVEIIDTQIEGLSMHRIARERGRSSKTIHD